MSCDLGGRGGVVKTVLEDTNTQKKITNFYLRERRVTNQVERELKQKERDRNHKSIHLAAGSTPKVKEVAADCTSTESSAPSRREGIRSRSRAKHLPHSRVVNTSRYPKREKKLSFPFPLENGIWATNSTWSEALSLANYEINRYLKLNWYWLRDEKGLGKTTTATKSHFGEKDPTNRLSGHECSPRRSRQVLTSAFVARSRTSATTVWVLDLAGIKEERSSLSAKTYLEPLVGENLSEHQPEGDDAAERYIRAGAANPNAGHFGNAS
ncbi:hypothetical protein CDAR_274381 [Caerostris darwini]|uniref:Uncharacterized protein n=1 Tax=Caerostris darwini TaxID=1538125 RepID=A0AAV4RF64_9ARAC|nr:hypothetical protein CDAR_274381 [Caerostris darwini]